MQQSWRCYAPADFRLLLQGTGLYLHALQPAGTVDWEKKRWWPDAPLEQAMKYVAQMKKVHSKEGHLMFEMALFIDQFITLGK
ncbi:MAG: hypothetical protein R2867_27220 [Caldilineaceae bacterium]